MDKFDNYQEAWAFATEQSRKYPSKGAYYASEEYGKLLPTLKDLYKTSTVDLAMKAKAAMKETKVKNGSCVERVRFNAWGMEFEDKGKVKIDKDGIPFVNLTHSDSGRKRIRWNKSFKIVKCPSETKKARRK